MNPLDACPAPPHWRLDWDRLLARHGWVRDLHDCPQDPEWHSEGDVGIHTRMALEQLATSTTFRELPPAERRIVFAAVLLHDVAKPRCTRTEESGRITSRGHSARGELLSRRLLWEHGVPFAEREHICALVRHHQVPFFLVDSDDAERVAAAISQSARCDLLALVAWADAAGRECRDQQRLLDNVTLFGSLCEELACLDRPRAFASDYARFEYFRTPGRAASFAAYDDSRCEVTVLSGLPASGKDHWIATHAAALPAVSLDAIRQELGIDPADPQGSVAAAARERALEHLRARRSFVWNATNLSRALRDPLIARFCDYHARVRIVYVERPHATIRAANQARSDPVPEHALARMLDRWDVPRPIEAHRVDHVTEDAAAD